MALSGELVVHLRVPLDPVHHAIPVAVERSAGVSPLVEMPLSLATPAISCYAWKMSQGKNIASSPSGGSFFRISVKLVLIASKYLQCLQRKVIYNCLFFFSALIVTAGCYHVPLKNRDFTEFLILIVAFGS